MTINGKVYLVEGPEDRACFSSFSKAVDFVSDCDRLHYTINGSLEIPERVQLIRYDELNERTDWTITTLPVL